MESETSARFGARFSGWGRTEKQALRSRSREGSRYSSVVLAEACPMAQWMVGMEKPGGGGCDVLLL